MDYKWRLVLVVLVADFMVFLDTTLTNIALPTIIRSLNTTLDRGQLVLTMYILALAVATLLTGYLADRFGSKRVYIGFITGFILASILCSLSWDINSLIFFRIIQGFSGGVIAPLGIALIFRTVPRHEHGSAMALFTAPMILAIVFGPLTSGYLVETWSWRAIWLLPLPIGILAWVSGNMVVRETERVSNLSFDYKGFILAGVGFCSALLALTRVTEHGWTATSVLGLFTMSGTALAAWVYVELHEKIPLLDLRILRNLTYVQAVLVFFLASVLIVTFLFMMPLYLQSVRGLSPIQSALLLMPGAIAVGIAMPISAGLYDRVGALPLIIPGLLAAGYAMFKLHGLDLTTSDASLIKILVLQGAGIGLVIMPAFTLSMSVHPVHAMARASALTNVLRQVLPAFGIAYFVVLLQTRQAFHFSNMAQMITPDSLAVMQVISRIKEAAGQLGAPDVVTSQAALQLLDGLVQQQAMVKAFNDVFLVATFLALFAVPLAIFLRKPKPEVEAQSIGAVAVAESAD